MELSPEEKTRIYEEEKARLEAREKATKELDAKKTKQGRLGYLLLIAVIFVIASIGGLFTSCTSTSSYFIDLKASVKFTGTQFAITNNDTFDWTNVKLELNDAFVLRAGTMRAGETYTVEAMQFAKEDGTRFNPLTTKLLRVVIFCDTPKGRGSWFGWWK